MCTNCNYHLKKKPSNSPGSADSGKVEIKRKTKNVFLLLLPVILLFFLRSMHLKNPEGYCIKSYKLTCLCEHKCCHCSCACSHCCHLGKVPWKHFHVIALFPILQMGKIKAPATPATTSSSTLYSTGNNIEGARLLSNSDNLDVFALTCPKLRHLF